MNSAGKVSLASAMRVGLLELFVVLIGLVFVRKEVYLAGQFSAMILHWQEYALLILMFIDGTMRGFGELHGQGDYSSPFRKKLLRYLLPFTLFLFVSCSSLCDKLNTACIHEEWWRDLGLAILVAGVFLCGWTQRTVPPELEAAIPPAPLDDPEPAAEAKPGTTDDTAADGRSAGGSPAPEKAPEPAPITPEPDPTPVPTPPPGPSPAEPSANKSSEITTTGPWNKLRYPGRTSILLELVGISMTLSAWMPLLTLPGLIVLFKWELADLEAFRISQFGKKYLNYKQRSWHLIPYIY